MSVRPVTLRGSPARMTKRYTKRITRIANNTEGAKSPYIARPPRKVGWELKRIIPEKRA